MGKDRAFSPSPRPETTMTPNLPNPHVFELIDEKQSIAVVPCWSACPPSSLHQHTNVRRETRRTQSQTWCSGKQTAKYISNRP